MVLYNTIINFLRLLVMLPKSLFVKVQIESSYLTKLAMSSWSDCYSKRALLWSLVTGCHIHFIAVCALVLILHMKCLVEQTKAFYWHQHINIACEHSPRDRGRYRIGNDITLCIDVTIDSPWMYVIIGREGSIYVHGCVIGRENKMYQQFFFPQHI